MRVFAFVVPTVCGRRRPDRLRSASSRPSAVGVVRRALLAAGALLTLMYSPSCWAAPPVPPGDDWLFSVTGEETLARQARGLAQLALNLTHPPPNLAADTPVEHAARPPFGINVFLEQEVEESKRERSMQLLTQAGFAWIRQEFPWEDIEIHGKGDFEDRRHEPHRSAWDKYDHIVDLAQRYDVEILARLSNPPAWTRADGDAGGSYAPPDDLTDWGDYVYAVASRYAGVIGYYQLWNEPNIYAEWGEQPVDPEAYTRLLCEGYRQIKDADPGAVVVSGALAPTVSLNRGPGPGLGMSDFVFLQRMYDAGAAECFDVLAVNDYMLWSGPTDRRMRPLNINFSRPAYVRDLMVVNGDAAKPIWISEMNSNAVPNDPLVEGVGAYGQVTPEQQAEYAVRAYQRVIEEWPWAGVVYFWFFKRASDAERYQSWYYFRMFEPDFTPLPVYDAMSSYTTDLRLVLHPGTYQEDHWALTYCSADEPAPDCGPIEGSYVCLENAGWETEHHDGLAYGPTYRRALSPGSAVRLSYAGAGLWVAPGPGTGEIEVTVNGREPRRVVVDGRPVRVDGGGLRGLVARALIMDDGRPTMDDGRLSSVVCRPVHVVIRAVSGEVGIDSVRVERPRFGLAPVLVGAAGSVILAYALWRRRRQQV